MGKKGLGEKIKPGTTNLIPNQYILIYSKRDKNIT